MGKYFNVTVRPTITASAQLNASDSNNPFAAGDILFNWTAFQIPKGSARLLSTTAIVRGVNGADQAAVDMELFFAKSINGTAPSTLGNLNAVVDRATATSSENTGWFRNIIGYQFFDASDQGMGSSDDLVYINTIQSPGNGGVGNLVLSGEPDSGDNVGYDTIYVAGIAQGSLDFGTTVLARGGTTADGSVAVVATDAGSDDDPNADLIFQPGDVLHSGTDDVLGTVKSIGGFTINNQAITFTSAIAATIADNEEIFNVNPITLVFSFEK